MFYMVENKELINEFALLDPDVGSVHRLNSHY